MKMPRVQGPPSTRFFVAKKMGVPNVKKSKKAEMQQIP